VPGTPLTFKESETVPIAMTTAEYPVADALQPLFPTLIGKGMKYFELKGDPENGSLAKSESPLNVSTAQFEFYHFMKHRSVSYSAEVRQLVGIM